MLYRKIAKSIENHLSSNSDKIMLIDGAHQIGKTYIVRYVINKLYTNVIEINIIVFSFSLIFSPAIILMLK